MQHLRNELTEGLSPHGLNRQYRVQIGELSASRTQPLFARVGVEAAANDWKVGVSCHDAFSKRA
jgi:hypothetical protein